MDTEVPDGVPKNLGYRIELAAEHVVETRRAMVAAQGAVDFEDLAPRAVAKAKAVQEGVGPQTVVLNAYVFAATGAFLPSQNQPRGTCTSRGVKRVLDLLQYAQMARPGSNRKFVQINHAIVYGLGREKAGMLGGNPNNENDDGCTGAAVAWAVVNGGNLSYEDTADPTDNENDDRLACLYGARGVPQEYKQKAKAHLVVGLAQVNSVLDAKAAIISGRGVTVASDIDYMGNGGRFVRDKDGVCRIGGHRWPHQMCLTGYTEDLNGRGPHFLQDQSWGPNSPSGPLGPISIPTYSFWCSESDVARQIAQRDSWTFASVEGWDADLLSHVM